MANLFKQAYFKVNKLGEALCFVLFYDGCFHT